MSESEQVLENKSAVLSKEVKLLVKDWILITLIVIKVTAIFIVAILADDAVIKVIVWSFGEIINQNPFAAKLLEGVQLLSALGTAIAYIFYLIRTLFRDARETIKDMKPSEDEERDRRG